MGIVIPAPAPFNMWVFKIPVSITYGGKIFPHTRPVVGITHGYPWGRVFLTSLHKSHKDTHIEKKKKKKESLGYSNTIQSN